MFISILYMFRAATCPPSFCVDDRLVCWLWWNCKGKAVPLQAWRCPDGSRKLRFPDFVTRAEDGGKVVSLTHRPPLFQEILLVLSGVPKGVWGVQTPPQKFWRPSEMVPNPSLLWKPLKIAEFRTPTPQDVRKKGSKILKLPRFAIVLH